jgi:hypothetical protein
MKTAPAIVVIGASAGGVDALLKLVAALPADLPAAGEAASSSIAPLGWPNCKSA